MLCLIYVSSATPAFMQGTGLVELLQLARRNNALHGITGMMIYSGGNFFQVLEGEAATVRRLYANIARDPRHIDVTVILEFDLAARQFPDWSMQLRDLGDLPPAERAECDALMVGDRGRAANDGLAHETRIVLDAFVTTMR